MAKTFAEVAFAAYNKDLPEGMEQGLEAVAFFDPPNFTWPFGTHVCLVEVDPATGVTSINRYVAVDDCGNVINPMIVEGQVHGGVLQGVAQALLEEVTYDPDSGQRIGGTFLDYLVPTINEMVPTEVHHTVTPTPSNVLGAKGVGEAGTIASSVAVINAICDALSPFGIASRRHAGQPAAALGDAARRSQSERAVAGSRRRPPSDKPRTITSRDHALVQHARVHDHDGGGRREIPSCAHLHRSPQWTLNRSIDRTRRRCSCHAFAIALR